MSCKLSWCFLLFLWAATFSRSNATQTAPSRTWKEMIGVVVEGDGSQLFKSTEPKMSARGDQINGPGVSDSIAEGTVPALTNGNFWEKHVYDNPDLVTFHLDENPAYGFPPDVEHWIVKTRVPPVTHQSFEYAPGEIQRSLYHSDPEWVDVMMRYIDHHDFYGWSGIDEKEVSSWRHSGVPHPKQIVWNKQTCYPLSPIKLVTREEAVWIDAVSGKDICRAEAADAIKWAGRHVLSVIHSKFPENEYQVLFNRGPVIAKPRGVPDLIHALVRKIPASELKPQIPPNQPSSAASLLIFYLLAFFHAGNYDFH
ncbi:hypothetical protein PCANC_11615 [Puccinia coronata f. sp. avenae]|uniref:Uncharacterized protein n=1 Tax=Puccinia coronata f. sp. avenae TaxID=200324 RepID=A0A2N5SVK1_9BASI|nr:hypothetical protein PCANC_11615 [Puccinia coronata f. sp. avenae]